MRIVIIGAGPIGRAIEHLLQSKNYQIDLWDIVEGKVEKQQSLGEIVPSADVVFLCVPSWSIRGAASEIQLYLRTETVIASVSKGIEGESQLFIDQLLARRLPDNPTALLMGPMLAAELSTGKLGFAVVASGNAKALEVLSSLFIGTTLTVERSDDSHSVAVASVLKNIYALLLGIADGLGYGNDAKGYLLARTVTEMQVVAKELKADPEVMLGTAGLADLVATGLSTSSRNATAGREIATTDSTKIRSEGLVSLPALQVKLEDRITDLPLLQALRVIVSGKQPASQVLQRLLIDQS